MTENAPLDDSLQSKDVTFCWPPSWLLPTCLHTHGRLCGTITKP